MPTWFEHLHKRCIIIAEVGQNHDGSLGTAHAYIDAIAKTGVDAVKFQTHIADAESTPAEPWRVKFSPQDATRYDYWKRVEFSEHQWQGLAEHARDRGLMFLSSPFSFAAVDLLERIGMEVWKVGAGEITNIPMIERMARTGNMVLLSSGMASWTDLDKAVSVVRRHNCPVAIFQCTTAYPCPPESVGLNVIGEIRERYGCPVGLSDHSGTIYAGLAAATLDVEMVEVHAVLSRESFGPDVSASLTMQELTQLAEGIRFIEVAKNNPVDKEAMASALSDLRRSFGKSIVVARNIPVGWCLRPEDLAIKKPAVGIAAARLPEFFNRRTTRMVPANSILSEDDLEPSQAS